MATVETPITSLTLLARLAGVADAEERKRAWERFVSSYEPVILSWGRRYHLPESELPALPGRLMVKLHRSLEHWETRRWLRVVAGPAADSLQCHLESHHVACPKALNSLLAKVGRDEWRRLEPIRARFRVQSEAKEPSFPVAELSHWWELVLTGWLEEYSLEPSLRAELIAAFQEAVRQRATRTTDADLPHFHNWLHMVVRNAVFDALEELHREEASGSTAIHQLLSEKPAREDLVRDLEYREILTELATRVTRDVLDFNWQVYHALVFDEQSVKEVAEKFEKTVGAIYKIRQRVQKVVTDCLKDMGIQSL